MDILETIGHTLTSPYWCPTAGILVTLEELLIWTACGFAFVLPRLWFGDQRLVALIVLAWIASLAGACFSFHPGYGYSNATRAEQITDIVLLSCAYGLALPTLQAKRLMLKLLGLLAALFSSLWLTMTATSTAQFLLSYRSSKFIHPFAVYALLIVLAGLLIGPAVWAFGTRRRVCLGVVDDEPAT